MDGTRRRIHFIETLGRGGFGAVYLADVHSQNDMVQRQAIKILSTEMNDVADVAARQRDEARLLAQLNHDHIVKVYDLIELDGRPAVMMEYVEGADASLLLRLGPFPPRAATELIAAAASALEAAHEAPSPRTGQPLRVVHRDIKPANLLISRHGGVKVLDFGIARAEFDREGKTTSVQYGTARYMAPEQWLFGQVSPAVDVYALGVSLAELLTARYRDRPPLERESFEAHLHTILGDITPTDSQNGLWYDDLHDLLRSMMAFDPMSRPSAGEVHERAITLAERAPGESLARLARLQVPPLIEARRQKYANDPLPQSLSFLRPSTHSGTLPAADRRNAQHGQSGPTLAQQPTAPTQPVRPARIPLLALAVAASALMMLLGAGGLTVGLYNLLSAPSPASTPSPIPEPEETPASALPVAPFPPTSGVTITPATSPAAISTSRQTPPPDVPSREIPSRAPGGSSPPSVAPEPTPAPTETPPSPWETPPSVKESPPAPAAAVSRVAPETRSLRFGGPAIGTAIYLDGTYLGQTPLRNTVVTHGTHNLEMHYDGEIKNLLIEVGPNTPDGYSWIAGTDRIVGQ